MHRFVSTAAILILLAGFVSIVSASSDEQERLDPDRPHLPEASTTVGKGRMILEGGYTYNERAASSFSSHDAPEALLRAGVLADWFEVRIGQNALKLAQTSSGVTSRSKGLEDLYLGLKFAITRQKRYLPEIAIIPQMTVPTGNHAVTGGRALPGLNIDGTWDIFKNRYGIEFVVGNNRVADDAGHVHLELATGLTNVVQLTHNLEGFGEWDMFKTSDSSSAPARHYAVGGLVLFVTRNLAVDFRSGTGLNAAANRFLIGAGFAFRR
jgi:hypothetical protein